jgi:hypothetical protein
MEEYYCDSKKYIDEVNEVAKLNEDSLANNPYASKMNLDNYPTHKYTDAEGNTQSYCAASKNY